MTLASEGMQDVINWLEYRVETLRREIAEERDGLQAWLRNIEACQENIAVAENNIRQVEAALAIIKGQLPISPDATELQEESKE